MAAKDLAFDSEARNALLEGVSKLAAAVKSTLGHGAEMSYWIKVGAAPPLPRTA